MDEERYDKLLFIVDEFGESKQAIADIQKLFPKFDPKNNTNDSKLSDFVIEQYAYSRSLGMDVAQAAYAAELSNIFIESCLEGYKLSLEVFLKLVKAERFAAAKMRREQLTILTQAAKDGDTKAAVTLMEKVWPKIYAKKLVIEEEEDPTGKWTDEELDSRIRALIADIGNERRESNS